MKRAARHLVGKPKLHCDFEDKNTLTKSTSSWTANLVAIQSGEKNTTGLVAQIGNHTVKSGSILQSLTAPSVGEAESYAVLKGCQVGLSLRSIYMDLGIPMKVEMQSDSSTSNSLTDRLGAGPRTKHLDTRYNSGTRTSSRWRPQYQEDAHRKNCADVGTKPVSAAAPQQHCKFAGFAFC